MAYVEAAIKAGLDVDKFAPRVSFFFNAHNNFLEEVAKFRAARRMHLYPVNGAAQRVGKNDMAYNFREALFAEVIVGVDPDPANAPKITKWCKDYWDALHPFSAGGAYVNFMMEEGQDRVQATYRDNYQRLAEIKSKYDPKNFFRVNQNIQPSNSR